MFSACWVAQRLFTPHARQGAIVSGKATEHYFSAQPMAAAGTSSSSSSDHLSRTAHHLISPVLPRPFPSIRFGPSPPSHPRPRASLLSLSLAASRPPASSRHRPFRSKGGGGGAKPGGRGKRMASEDGCGGGNPPGDAAAAPPVWNAAPAAGAGCGDLEEDLRFQCCVCLWVTPRLLSVFFLRPCCSDLCRRMSRRSPFVDWTFVLRDYAPSLLIQCNSPLIFVVDIFFFASILCSIHCAVPKFLRSDIKLRYC